ncbi:MAG: peptidylprolyl isomerase, partial [Candidatus Thermoplasmatota archaeon]
VIQGGDPNSKDNNPYNDGWGGSGETIPLEINSSLTHEDGAVGMARGEDPNSASSQFYICDGAQHQLDGDYAVFGIVIEGIEVVRKIASAETYGYKRPLLKDHPVEDIVMLRVWVIPGYWTNNSQALDSTSLFLRSVLDLKSIIFFSLLIVGIIAFILYKKLAPIYKRV